MAAFSAKNAAVNKGAAAVIEVLEWELNPEQTTPDYRSSSSSGWAQRVSGFKDVTGSFRVLVDDTTPIWDTFSLGEEVADLRMYEDAVNYHSGPAIISSIVPRADIDGDGIMEVTVNFVGNGAWTFHQP